MELEMFLIDYHRWIIGVSILLNVFFVFTMAVRAFTRSAPRQFEVKITESKRGLFRWYIVEKDGLRSGQCTGSFTSRHLCEVHARATLGNIKLHLV